MRAAGRIVRDFALAIGAKARRFGGRGRFLRSAQIVYALHEQEHAQRDQKKVDHGLNEIADGDGRRILRFAQTDHQRREIHAAGQLGDQWREQIVYNAGYDGGKSGADHDADRHIEYIALEREFLEFLNKLPHTNPSLCMIRF